MVLLEPSPPFASRFGLEPFDFCKFRHVVQNNILRTCGTNLNLWYNLNMNTVRLEPELKDKIQRLAQIQGISQSELHRRALVLYCQHNTITESRFEDIFGIAEGESDLSSRTGEVFADLMKKKHG